MRQLLIISPRFPPINAADHQRIRMSLPYFRKFGWEPTVLSVNANYVEGIYDELLPKTVPDDIEVIATSALPVVLTRRVGLGSLSWRCLPYFAKAGRQLLASRKYDLIYFSTTAFPVLSLAAAWYKEFRVPYVIDFQDPWLSTYHTGTEARPPGGRLKYAINQLFARMQEPKALKQVSHVVSVSPAYSKMLSDRYPWLMPSQFSELPFGAPQKDFELLSSLNVKQSVFDPNDGFRHWVYVGRGGDDMAVALRLLFSSIQRLRQSNDGRWQPTKLHFIGTSYAPAHRAIETIMPIAEEFELADIVEERTGRIHYFEALKTLTDSDAILLIGSDDPAYTASKLYPCILAQRPILAVFHEESSVVSLLERCNAGHAVTFNSIEQSQKTHLAIQAELDWLLSSPRYTTPQTNWRAFEPYTAREMTRKQCEIFDRCMTEQKI